MRFSAGDGNRCIGLKEGQSGCVQRGILVYKIRQTHVIEVARYPALILRGRITRGGHDAAVVVGIGIQQSVHQRESIAGIKRIIQDCGCRVISVRVPDVPGVIPFTRAGIGIHIGQLLW